jgi:phage tail-like protein
VAITVEQLLATLAVDAAETLEVSDRFAIIMRDPQPAEAGVPAASQIFMRVVDLNGIPADPSSINIRVLIDQGAGDVIAYDGATFVSPWIGGLSAVVGSTGADPYCFLDVTLDQTPMAFASEAVVNVTVDVVSGSGGWGHFTWGHVPWGHAGNTGSGDLAYAFTAADTIAPNLLSAVAVGPRTVRVTFDDAMAAGVGMVDDLTSWVPATLGAPEGFHTMNVDPLPGVDLTCVAVEVVPDTGGRVWDLSTQWAMTPECPYGLTVRSTVEDDAGNAIATASVAFLGYVPAQPATRFFDYGQLCVPIKNRTEDVTRDLERFANCIGEVLTYLIVQIDHWTDAYDTDRCTDAEVDDRLADLGNPFDWAELDMTADQRRKLLGVLVDIYRRKGTASGIERVIYLLLGETVTVEPYAATGWVLGEDCLGEGDVAMLYGLGASPYDLSAGSTTLTVEVEGIPSTATIQPADFTDATAATASQVATILAARLPLCGAFAVNRGVPARLTALAVAPYTLSGGDTLEMTINTVPVTVTFHVDDIVTPGSATAEEVQMRLALELEHCVTGITTGLPFIETIHTGDNATIAITGGTGAATLGWAGGVAAAGADADVVALYNLNPGADATLAVTGGTANVELQFPEDLVTGTGGAILAASDAHALYSFDIETARVLTSAEETLVRRIANYMKPAHTHLMNVRVMESIQWPDVWVLGVDSLDVDADLSA